MSRERDGPAQFLKDYRGFLHADAYGGYDGIYLASDQTIVEVACWRMRGGNSSRPGRPTRRGRTTCWP